MATNAEVGATRAPGLTWSAVRTSEPDDSIRPAVLGGAIGWGLAILAGAGSPGRLVAVGLGAAAGAFAARYRVHVDWNPETPELVEAYEPEPAALIAAREESL